MKAIKRSASENAFVKLRCKCGIDICFYNDYPAICKNCGRKIYPSQRSKFKEKIDLEMRKTKYE